MRLFDFFSREQTFCPCPSQMDGRVAFPERTIANGKDLSGTRRVQTGALECNTWHTVDLSLPNS
jgi:hypothetical protein